jgi:hypothetical protein
MIQRTKPNRAESFSARFFVICMVLLLAACGAKQAALTYSDGAVKAIGWSGAEPNDGWQSVLVVRTGEDASAPAVLGDYRMNMGVLSFTPRFPPSPGVKLHVEFRMRNGSSMRGVYGDDVRALIPIARVTHIYPTTDEWPANTLKMYVEFSEPMAIGEAYDHVRILDDKGVAVEGPFVEIDQELWDPEGKRVTLLFDPGRIKRGLVDNEQSGPPLMPGRTITIEIDPSWRSATGAPLVEKFSRTIRVTEALRETVDPKRWKIDPPKAQSDPLIITFDRPLDHALAQRAISVWKNGSPVAGEIALEEKETRLRFTPSATWQSGSYTIRVDGVIEDLAGNRLGKLFDVDTSDATQATSATPVMELTFTVPAR